MLTIFRPVGTGDCEKVNTEKNMCRTENIQCSVDLLSKRAYIIHSMEVFAS